MDFEVFATEHMEAAERLAAMNYAEEQSAVSALPKHVEIPSLAYFAKNGYGISAFENGRLVGFLCWYQPWSGAFDMENALGTFSPIHAHAAIKEQRDRIYQRLYEKAAQILASQKVLAHAIAFYAHDKIGIDAMFDYGFGKRCVDRVAVIDTIPLMKHSEAIFEELPLSAFPEIRPLRKRLNDHLRRSPCFLQNTDEECEEWLRHVEQGDRRTFIAGINGEAVAYLDVADEGENFITVAKDMANIQGAFCAEEYRGSGLMQDLLSYTMNQLKNEGIKLLGVDHESYNPNGNRFWGKYFTAYTYSLVRRIEQWAAQHN